MPRGKANHYLTGRDGGRDIDLRRFATEGMELHGGLLEIEDGVMRFGDDLARNLDAADAVYNGICALIDRHIEERGIDAPEGRHYQPVWQPGDGAAALDPSAAGITSIIWATGFKSSTAPAIPTTNAASRRSKGFTSSACPGAHIGLGPLRGSGQGCRLHRRPCGRTRPGFRASLIRLRHPAGIFLIFADRPQAGRA